MTTISDAPDLIGAASRRPAHVDIVVPVLDEVVALGPNIRRLHAYLRQEVPLRCRITIADNGSTDGTWALAQSLSAELPDVEAVRLEDRGRGRALHHVWSRSDADVLAYMDVDLSTDLAAFLPLVAPLLSGHSDVAIGTRLSRTSRVVRGPRREIISRSYNLLLRTTLRARFSDAQCGFKAVRADRARELLPLVEDTGWFFDTELLVIAERAGLRIHEVPVDWVDDPDSRVDVLGTALDDLRGILRVGRSLASGRLPLGALARREVPRPLTALASPGLVQQLLRFGAVGVVSTLAYLLLYLVLRPVADAQVANAVALVVTALGNTWANRIFTFGVRGREGAARHQAQGLVVFAVGLGLTSGSLAAVHSLVAAPSRAVEVAALVAANAAATLVRFLLLRAWVFRPARGPSVLPVHPPHTTVTEEPVR